MTLQTEVTIKASPKQVWDVLIDFAAYQHWNSSIPNAQGNAIVGSAVLVTIHWPGLKKSPYALKILKATPERELRWLGHVGKGGLMDGDHSFVIDPMEEARCRVTQIEHFSGWLVPFFSPWLKSNVLNGFERMNGELRDRVESLRANSNKLGPP